MGTNREKGAEEYRERRLAWRLKLMIYDLLREAGYLRRAGVLLLFCFGEFQPV
jgi:hypothetical protein